MQIYLNLTHLLAALLQPFLPDTAESIARQLDLESVLFIPETFDCGFTRPGHRLGEAECLFTKIDPKRAEDWKAQRGGSRLKAVIAEEMGSDKNGKKSKVGSAALNVLRRKSDDTKKQPGGQEDQPNLEAPAPDGSPTVEGRLAQALRLLSFE